MNNNSAILTASFLLAFFIAHSLKISAQCNVSFELGNDTTIDCGASIQLQGATGLNSYSWSNGSSNSSISVSNPGTYWCTAYEYLNNLVTNGDFSGGTVGFTSGYLPGSGGQWGLLSNEGEYAVTSNTSLVHNNFPSCFDHTTGTASGSMLVVNGSITPGIVVWEQTVTVAPNTDYAFSAWAMSVVSSNPAQLSFSINGTQIGNTFNLSSTTCNWQQFSANWNSGANTTAVIAIVNNNIVQGGNDFAVDDIEFSSVCVYTDTIQISIPNSPQLTILDNDTVCSGDSIMLVAITDIPGCTIDWFHSAQTNDTIYVSPTTNTIYSASAISPQNCYSNTASVHITVGNKPELTASANQSMCEGDSVEISFTSVEPLESFQWSPNAISTEQGLVSPTASTQYVVTGVNEWGCADSDSIEVTVFPIPTVAFEQNEFSICEGDSVVLSLVYDTNNVTQLNWSFGNHNASTYSYFPDSDDSISIRISQNGCQSETDTARISVTEVPSIDSIENVVTCPGEEVTFTTVANPAEATITWDPEGITGTQYTTFSNENAVVSAFAQLDECRSNRVEAEIIIVDSCLCIWTIPNVFTPNNDGLNDIFGVVDLNESCEFSGFELVVYNRWGEKVWEGINQEKPWDGKSNGNLLPSGTYFWKLNMTDQFNKKVTESGTVTLLE